MRVDVDDLLRQGLTRVTEITIAHPFDSEFRNQVIIQVKPMLIDPEVLQVLLG